MATYEYRRDERWSRTWVVEVPDGLSESEVEGWVSEHIDPENRLDGDVFEFVEMMDGADVFKVA